MRNILVKKPSDFALSRYILNESDQEEKSRIETWINFSQNNREEFSEFQKIVYQEEQGAPAFPKKKLLPEKIILTNNLRYGLTFSAFATLFLLSVISFSIVTDFNKKSNVEYSEKAGSYYPVFRDTLEVLLRLTCKDNQNSAISFHSLNRADRTVSTNKNDYQIEGVYRADRTIVYRDFSN